MRKIKKRYILLSMPIILFGLFYLWIEYQQSTREVVDIDSLSSFHLSENDDNPAEGHLSGKVKLDRFEKVSTISAEQREDTIFIYLTKTKGISTTDEISLRLGDVLMSQTGSKVNNVLLISGDAIIVHNEEDPTKSYIDVSNFNASKEIWSSNQ